MPLSKAFSLLSIHLYIFFEIGQKMTKLRAKTCMPARARNAVFGHYLAIKCPNFNIFVSDLFYMINKHKVHVIAKLQLNWV